MLNNDKMLDEEEKAKLEHHALGRKFKLVVFIVILLFVTICGLWVKNEFSEISAIAFAMVSAGGLYFGANVAEDKFRGDRRRD